jgi:hypothetical protein
VFWIIIFIAVGVVAYFAIAIGIAYFMHDKWYYEMVDLCWIWPIFIYVYISLWINGRLHDPPKIDELLDLSESPKVAWEQEKKKHQ